MLFNSTRTGNVILDTPIGEVLAVVVNSSTSGIDPPDIGAVVTTGLPPPTKVKDKENTLPDILASQDLKVEAKSIEATAPSLQAKIVNSINHTSPSPQTSQEPSYKDRTSLDPLGVITDRTYSNSTNHSGPSSLSYNSSETTHSISPVNITQEPITFHYTDRLSPLSKKLTPNQSDYLISSSYNATQADPWSRTGWLATDMPFNSTLHTDWPLNDSMYELFNSTDSTTNSSAPTREDYEELTPLGYLSGYSVPHVIIASICVTLLMLIIVIGNALVIIAIAKDRNLKGLQNWFIASLAVSDLLVGLLIMPFSLANELMGYWYFGNVMCELWLATDVLLCTASILNLCLISLDRYWSITRAISYVKTRTKRRAIIMITVVWILSMIICFPPLVGWKRPQPMKYGYPLCVLSEDKGYVIYSTLGSFYIPLIVMVVVYFKIYLAARSRARRGLKKQQKAAPVNDNGKSTSTTTTTSFSNQQKCQEEPKLPDIDSLSEAEVECKLPSAPSGMTSTEEGEATNDDIKLRSVANPNAHFRPIDEKKKLLSDDTDSACESPIRTRNQKNIKNQRRIHFSEDTDSTSDNTFPHNKFNNYKSKDKCSTEENMKPLLEDSQLESDSQKESDKCSSQNNNMEASNQLSEDKSEDKPAATPGDKSLLGTSDGHFDEEEGQGNTKKTLLLSPATFRRVSMTVRKANVSAKDKHKRAHDDPDKQKKRIARARERRATIVLGIIMATFILCWLPFFSTYVISSVSGLPVPGIVFAFFFWAGYCNSGLNPVIYTIFNRDFRHAFQKIICGRRH